MCVAVVPDVALGPTFFSAGVAGDVGEEEALECALRPVDGASWGAGSGTQLGSSTAMAYIAARLSLGW